MRYQRLILESGSNAVTVRFHPRLTVIAGVGPVERESLFGELLGAMAGTRRGVHLEVVEDKGRRLAFLRSTNGDSDRVLDLQTASDVSHEFVKDGRVDVWQELGISLEIARSACRLDAAEFATMSRKDSLIVALAALNQRELWAAAGDLEQTIVALESETTDAGIGIEDAGLIEAVEDRHVAFESAQHRYESVRHHGLFIGGAGALGAIPAAFLMRWTAFVFLAVAVVTTVVSVFYRRRMDQARQLEKQALVSIGADSYYGFHVQRMNEVLQGRQQREGLAASAVRHREAKQRWQQLVGDVSLEWARNSREEILVEAAQLDRLPVPAEAVGEIDPAELAEELIKRMANLRRAGRKGESIPLILDEPFQGLDTPLKLWALDLIARSAGSPQIVYLTEDPDVAAWARTQAQNGESTVIEPAPETDLSQEAAAV